MNNDNKKGNELKSPNPLRRLYDEYAAGVAYISVITAKGDEGIGSCFHIGGGVFITARHVVENCIIKEIGTTVSQRRYYEVEETKTTGMASVEFPFSSSRTSIFAGPYFHPNDKVDIAALVVPDIKAPILPLGDHLDDWLGYEHILSNAVVFGYPPVPFSSLPTLLAAKCEVNAIIDKYTGGHPQFILSSMARGGFSGGPAVAEDGVVLGVITESLVNGEQPPELGYFSAISVEGIYTCLAHNRIIPKHIDEEWDGFWNEETISFKEDPNQPRRINNSSLRIYRGIDKFYFVLYTENETVIKNTLEIIDNQVKHFYSLTWVHDSMVKIEFKEGSFTLEQANQTYSLIIEMMESMGIKKETFEPISFKDFGQPF